MTKKCEAPGCNKPVPPGKKLRRFCGDTCRKRASRAGTSPAAGTPVRADPAEPPASLREFVSKSRVTESTYDELVRCGRHETPLGRLALSLALRLDVGIESASAMASVSKELRATMIAATANAAKADDPVDELQRRRDERRRRGA